MPDREQITSAWGPWYHASWLKRRLGLIPPAEAEAAYYAQSQSDRLVAHTSPSVRNRGRLRTSKVAAEEIGVPAKQDAWFLRMPPNTFGIAFGLAGLALLWTAVHTLLAKVGPIMVGTFAIAAVVWVVLLGAYLVKSVRRPQAVRTDVTHTIQSPFLSLAPISGMVLGSVLQQWAPVAALWLVAVCAALTLGYGGWLTGQWIVGPLDQQQLHPGYFLPTVAGGLVGCAALHSVGLTSAAYMAFGIGIVCWFVIGSVLLQRLFFLPSLPPPLLPLLAIEVAPPAVAGNAWFALHDGRVDPVQLGLAAYTLLMVVVQLRLVPAYLKLSFTPAFWAFAFSYTSVAVYGARWLVREDPPGAAVLAWTLVVVVTLFVLWIAVRTVVELRRGRYFPAVPVAPAPVSAAAPQA